MMKKLVTLALACAAALLVPTMLSALTLLGSDAERDNLVRISTKTGKATVIGSLGPFPSVGGLAYTGGRKGRLLATESAFRLFLEIDRRTGRGTVIGSLGTEGQVNGLAFRRGVLYGSEATNEGSRLVTINMSTGAATPIGTIGFDYVRGLAFAPNGTLFGIGSPEPTNASDTRLITINTATGAGTFVGLLGTPRVSGLEWARGRLYASRYGPDDLLTVNPRTAETSVVGPFGPNGGFVGGLTRAPAPIPLPAAAPLLGAGILMMGALGLRRRHTNTVAC